MNKGTGGGESLVVTQRQEEPREARWSQAAQAKTCGEHGNHPARRDAGLPEGASQCRPRTEAPRGNWGSQNPKTHVEAY